MFSAGGAGRGSPSCFVVRGAVAVDGASVSARGSSLVAFGEAGPAEASGASGAGGTDCRGGGFERIPIMASAEGRRAVAVCVGCAGVTGAATGSTAVGWTAAGGIDGAGGAPDVARGAIDFRGTSPSSFEHEMHSRVPTGLKWSHSPQTSPISVRSASKPCHLTRQSGDMVRNHRETVKRLASFATGKHVGQRIPVKRCSTSLMPSLLQRRTAIMSLQVSLGTAP